MTGKFVCAVAICVALPFGGALAHGATYAVHHPNEPVVSADKGRIYFYRESSIAGVVLEPAIKIDGEKAGKSSSGDYFYVDRAPGTYTVSTSTEKDESTTVTVTAGQIVYVKTSVSMGFFVGHVSPEVVSSDTAEKEISDCDYVGTETPAAAPAGQPPATQAPSAMAPAQAPAAQAPQTPTAPPTTPPAPQN